MTRPELFFGGDTPCLLCGERPATVEGEECPPCYASHYIAGEMEYDPQAVAGNTGGCLWSLPGYRDAQELIEAAMGRAQ